ncbi:MAG: DUF502 domain-containing protein [Myxococcales bacterium]|nr:MAG: DUF502 domain-containing protein [Myxococcales bacterium]
MKTLGNNFLKGLLIVGPLAITLYVVYAVVNGIDRLLNIPIPGLGLLLTVSAITFIGLVASNVVGRRLLRLAEKLLNRLPFVRFLYSAIKDLVSAFVGERRGFDRPVMVQLSENPSIAVMGFLTTEEAVTPELADHVTVYLPQSYNFAGNLILVHRSAIRPLNVESSRLMALIVSGGVSSTANKATMPPQAPR